MTSIFQKRGANINQYDLQAQAATTQNPLFPFSSPYVDHRSSLTSNRTESTVQSQDDSAYPNDKSTVLGGPNRIGGTVGLYPTAGKHGRNLQVNPKNILVAESAKSSARKRSRPGLQIVTDFSQSQFRPRNVVLNQVAVKHPEQIKSKTRSIVSQQGISVLPTPLPNDRPVEVLPGFQNLINRNQENKLGISKRSKPSKKPGRKETGFSPSRSTVLFGLQIPEHEASLRQDDDKIQSSITLVTPITPKIIITPADKQPQTVWDDKKPGKVKRDRRWSSPTSVYSKFVSQYHTSGTTQGQSPSPAAIARETSAPGQANRRFSSESQQQILADSCDTARPKSQGWWNLVLSPILSRVGTLKKTRLEDEIPPVPPMPTENEKTVPFQTPMTNFSPETPRRLGLANVRSSTWSQWTDCEGGTEINDSSTSSPEEVAAMPRDHLANERQFNPLHDSRNEGLAAEYYHACAVEQLANITYFECINHSCANHLPKLQSIYDSHNPSNISRAAVLDSDGTNGIDKYLMTGSNHKLIDDANIVNQNSREIVGNRAPGSDSGTRQPIQGPSSPIDSEIDVEEIVSPNIREANTAAFSRAKTINSREPSPVPVPSATKSSSKQLDINPTRPFYSQAVVESPGPISPEATRVIAPREAMPMAPIQSLSAETTAPLVAPVPQASHALVAPYQPPPNFMYYPYPQTDTYHIVAHPAQQFQTVYQAPLPIGSRDASNVEPTGDVNKTGENNQDRAIITEAHSDKDEKDVKSRKIGFFGLCCCFRRNKMGKTKNKRWKIGLAAILLIVIILCILFAILFTRGNGEANPITSQLLNLSGYPPMPTGISTIAQPNLSASQNKCTSPTTLWSCSLPKEDQAAISPNEPDQPNFRFQIRFRNGTVPANMTIPLGKRSGQTSADDLFVPNPNPPGQPDQLFLGSTTDNSTKPVDGETTPFFITFMSAVPEPISSAALTANKKLTIRQTNSSDLLNAIPAPSLDADGSAAPATLLPTTPFPISQPIKLYNRGLPDEHYGFYIYYDKSIFLSAFSLRNGTAVKNNDQSLTNADQNGGTTKSAANIRCTWSQTRFVVRMYTNPRFGASLLSSPSVNVTSSNAKQNNATSATDFNRPGSFPYPTTILLDRHGGDINKKLIYCYGMSNGSIAIDEKVLVSEDRSFGGVLVNPAPSILNSGSSTFNSSVGGIDGGTGGCGCTWQNWV